MFVTPPSVDELKNRLIGRGTETMEVIEGRLKRAAEEANGMDQYEYLLINENDKVEECVDRLHQIIQSEHFRTLRNVPLIKQIQEDAQKLSF